MTLQKEYELITKIFNDNFNGDEELKLKVFKYPYIYASSSLLDEKDKDLAELLINIRMKIDKKENDNYSILKKFCNDKKNTLNGMYEINSNKYIILYDGFVMIQTPYKLNSIIIKENTRNFDKTFDRITDVNYEFEDYYSSEDLKYLIKDLKNACDLLKAKQRGIKPVVELYDGYFLNAEALINILSLYRNTGVYISHDTPVNPFIFESENHEYDSIILPVSPKTIAADKHNVVRCKHD